MVVATCISRCPLNRGRAIAERSTPCFVLADCCEPLERVRENGIVMSKLACLARCNGAHAETHEFGEFTLEEFR